MLARLSIILTAALAVLATPLSSRQATGDNGACHQQLLTCASSVDTADLSNAWSIESCVFGATCVGGQRPVDNFLAELWTQVGGTGTAPSSVNLPRVTTAVSLSGSCLRDSHPSC